MVEIGGDNTRKATHLPWCELSEPEQGADGGTAIPGAGSRFINRINRAEVRN